MAKTCNFHLVLLSFVCFTSILHLRLANGAPAAPTSKLTGRQIRSIIDQSLPRSVVPSIAGSSREWSRRVKRSPTTKELVDPNDCIHKCWDQDDQRTEQIQTSFENKVHTTDHIGEDEATQRNQLQSAMDNLGSLMHDACEAAKKTKSCFQACPATQLKDVAIADNNVEDVACEPDKNFGGYNNYRMAIACLNNTLSLSREYCEKQCHGSIKLLSDVTQLGIDRNDTESSNVNYEADIGRNVNSVKEQCRIITCTRDCSKSYIMKRCGQKGFDLYSRQLAVEPRSTLAILQKLGAINTVPQECNSLK